VVPVLPAQDFFFDPGGVRIHYTVEGSGEPVPLIHGYPVSAATNWALPGLAILVGQASACQRPIFNPIFNRPVDVVCDLATQSEQYCV